MTPKKPSGSYYANRRAAVRKAQLAELQAQVDAGELVIRQATPEEVATWAGGGRTRAKSIGSASSCADGQPAPHAPDSNPEANDV